ncbi:hypothetical protein V495_01637, partial [Pseudogymnoascus sp. VKM F-4514 (FW-929)]
MATAVATPLPVPVNDAPPATIAPVKEDNKLLVSAKPRRGAAASSSLNKGIFYHTDEDAAPNSGAANGVTTDQSSPWRSGVVLMPPGTAIDNPLTMLPAGLPGVMIKLGLRSVKKMIIDFEGSVKSARKAGLRKGEDPYYVFFVGTAAAHQGRGIGGEVVKRV